MSPGAFTRTGVVVVSFCALVAAARAELADEAAVRQIIQRMFGAYAHKDLDGFMSEWSPLAPDYAARKQNMQRIFAQTGKLDLKELSVVKLAVDGDAARGRVRFEITGKDLKTGELHSDLGRLNRLLLLKKSQSRWKVVRYVPAEQDLIDRLAAAQSKDARAEILDADKDLVDFDFVGLLVRQASTFVRKGKHPEARPWYDLAFEVSRTLPDKHALAEVYLSYGYFHATQEQPTESARDFDEALAVARQLNDKRLQALAFYNVGRARVDMKRPADAIDPLDKSIALAHEIGHTQCEGAALNEAGVALQRVGRWKEAADRYQAGLALVAGSGNKIGELNARRNVGEMLDRAGRYAEALRMFEPALTLARDLKDGLAEMQVLFDIGNMYLETAEVAKARQKFEESLAVARRLGEKLGESQAIGNIGLVDSSTGRFAEAIARQEESLKLAREAGSEGAESRALSNLGRAYADVGRSADALRNYEAGLKMDLARGDRQSALVIRGNIANAHQAAGRYADAVALYEENIKTARELENRHSEAISRSNLGAALKDMGRYPEAADQIRSGLRVYRELGDRHGEANGLASLGDILQQFGRYREALEHHEAALAIRRAIDDRAGEAGSLMDIGLVYIDLGRYGEAFDKLEASLATYHQLGKRRGESKALNNLGFALQHAGRYAEAAARYHEALDLGRKLGNPLDEMIALRNLATLDLSYGRYEDARQAFQSALAIARSLKSRSQEAISLEGIGRTCTFLDKYQDARQALDNGLAIARETGQRKLEGLLLTNIAILSYRQKRYEEARIRYGVALAAAESLGDAQTSFRCHWDLGLVYADLKRWPDAVAEFRKSVAGIEALRGGLGEWSLRASFLNENITPYVALAGSLIEEAGPNAVAEAFAVVEQAKARSLVETLRQGKADLRKGMTEAERSDDERLHGNVTALGVQVEAAQQNREAAAKLPDLKKQFATAQDEYEQFRRRAFLAHPELQARQGRFEPASLTDLNRDLFARRPGLYLVSYLIDPTEVYIFVVRSGPDPAGTARLSLRRSPIKRKDLEQAVDVFRAACRSPTKPTPDPKLLYEKLLGPIAADVASATHLVIVPDGCLNGLPFQALADANGKYLIERLSVSYAPSATALVKMTEQADRQRSAANATTTDVMAVGRPAFGGALKDLPASEAEARSIAALYEPKAKLLLGATADRSSVLAALTSARIAHLATHGLVNESNPLYSAIALSPRTGADDGRLYARDLLDTDLHVNLVVLSACETALGRQVKGEGVLGLAWSLFVAGAPASVVTQWSVADESTKVLMVEFHKLLAAGGEKAGALRQAQLALLNGYDARTGRLRGVGGVAEDTPSKSEGGRLHPFYWAPFVLIGDWR
jgi:CHAT domain-containing protein/tetratricopeptide (TPR) repeat protein